MEPLTLASFPRAILHIDGDAFFASCEQSRRPKLQGRPVVTGKERGIAASMSYEAKARGVTRGMRISDIRKICPDAVILPSDYETYSLLSKRFFAIVRRYTPDVEEYSIDECFCDLTGLRRPLRMSYFKIAERMKRELDTELGFTFSVGLAPNNTVSDWRLYIILLCFSMPYLPTEEKRDAQGHADHYRKRHRVTSSYEKRDRPQETPTLTRVVSGSERPRASPADDCHSAWGPSP
jgi:impB/mucB/samB family protein